MKLLEVTVDGGRVTIRREAEEWLTKDQKYKLLLAGMGCAAACIIVASFFHVF